MGSCNLCHPSSTPLKKYNSPHRLQLILCFLRKAFKPKIQKRAVVVLSNNDGCVISRSQEAKDMGIKMAEPYFKVKKLITRNKIEVYSSNYALYGDIFWK